MNAMSKHTQREREGEKGKMDCKGIKKKVHNKKLV